MSNLRLAATLALFAALIVAAGRAGPTTEQRASSTACTPHALGAAFAGQLELQSIDNFGCAGNWAYIWATVGSAAQEVGVTDVARFSPGTATWGIVSRALWCKPHLLPNLVYRQGCFSN